MNRTRLEFPGALDGNVLGGPFAEVFGADLTGCEVTCASCARVAVLADLVVYSAGPGITARCRGCGEVMARLARIRDNAVLDLGGIRVLRVGVHDAASATPPR